MSAVAVRQIPVPVAMRRCTTLAPVDYEDAFAAGYRSGAAPCAMRWAELVLQEGPRDLRRTVLSGWRALGFALGPIPAEGFVLGWEIRHSEPDLAVLATTSPLGIAGELVFKREPRVLLYATFVRLRGDAARRAWARIEAAHPPVVRELLLDAAARLAGHEIGGGRDVLGQSLSVRG